MNPSLFSHHTPNLLNGLVSYWKFDEASGTRFDSVSSNNLSASGGPISVPGILGSAVQLVSGSAQWLSMLDDPSLSFLGSFTWAGWVNLRAKASSNIILGKGTAGGLQFGEYQLLYSGGGTDKWKFSLGNGTSGGASTGFVNQFSQAGAVTTGQWTFLCAWFDIAVQKINLQINNGVVNSNPCAITSYDSAFGVRFGRDFGSTPSYWDGSLDGWGVWNRVLTTPERAYLYNAGRGFDYPFHF